VGAGGEGKAEESAVKVELYIELEWDESISDLVPFKIGAGVRVLSFSRQMELPFVPPKGMNIFLDDAPLSGHKLDPPDVEVEGVSWDEAAGSLHVDAKRVYMGDRPDNREELAEDVRWMKLAGFVWLEEEYRKSHQNVVNP
jgi:hypothetical protein